MTTDWTTASEETSGWPTGTLRDDLREKRTEMSLEDEPAFYSRSWESHRPPGITSDSVLAEADLMTLVNGREPELAACLSASPDRRRWRALRAARSLMAFGVEGESPSAAGFAARSPTSPELPAGKESPNQTVNGRPEWRQRSDCRR